MEPTLKFERRSVFLSHHLEIQTLNVISVINNVPGFFLYFNMTFHVISKQLYVEKYFFQMCVTHCNVSDGF